MLVKTYFQSLEQLLTVGEQVVYSRFRRIAYNVRQARCRRRAAAAEKPAKPAEQTEPEHCVVLTNARADQR